MTISTRGCLLFCAALAAVTFLGYCVISTLVRIIL